MSRVYDIPRYKNQTLHKVRMHIEAFVAGRARQRDPYPPTKQQWVYHAFGNKDMVNIETGHLDFILNFMDNASQEFQQEWDDGTSYYERYVQEESYAKCNRSSMADVEIWASMAIVGELLMDLILHHCVEDEVCERQVWCDHDATIRLYEYLLDPKREFYCTEKQEERIRKSRAYAYAISGVSAYACNHGLPVVAALEGMANQTLTNEYMSRKAVLNGVEALRLNSMTPEIKAAYEKMRNGDDRVDFRKMRNNNPTMHRNLGLDPRKDAIYRILFWYIIVTDTGVFILDYPCLDQLHGCVKMMEGFYGYGEHYRKIGDPHKDRFLDAVMMAHKWMHDAIVETNYSEWLPANMRMSVQILQNQLHMESEVVDFGATEKDRNMRVQCAEQLELHERWHDFLGRLGLKERTKLDLANLYYALPAPDIDISELNKKFQVTMQNVNEVDQAVWDDFMAYSKMSITVHIMSKFRKTAMKFWMEKNGVDREENAPEWVRSACKGIAVVPERQYWGQAGMPGFLHWKDTASYWHWEATDVSRAESHLAAYATREDYYKLPKYSHNELLYAMKHAPYLDYVVDPTTLWKSNHQYDNLCTNSGKAENTKPGSKVREILAGCDITRVKLSDINTNAMTIGHTMPGVSSNKPPERMYTTENDLCKMTTDGKTACVISNDIKSWSTLAPKSSWEKYIDMELEFYNCPDGVSYSKANKGLTSVIRKRGQYMKCEIDKCMQQGWTGESDTHLHYNLMAYCVRTAKEKGLLPQNVSARTSTLIDDAVQGIAFPTVEDFMECSEILKAYIKHVEKTYVCMGAAIHTDKTLMSSFKWIFLNHLYCQGTEVCVSAKIDAKADRSFDRRTATIYEQCDTVFGGFYAAVGRGSDPVASYYRAICRSLELIMMTFEGTAHRFHHFQVAAVVNAFFAPRSLGGWGFPHINGWLNQESRDSLMAYGYVISTNVRRYHNSPHPERHAFAVNLSNQYYMTIRQILANVSPMSFMTNPFAVHAFGVVDPASVISGIVEQAMLSHIESEEYRRVMGFRTATGLNEGLDVWLRSCVIDANLLQRLAMTMPSALAREILSRVVKNELVQNLLPFRMRTRIANNLRNMNRRAVTHLFRMQTSLLNVEPVIKPEMVCETTISLRETFYALHGYSLVNHTFPDVATSYRAWTGVGTPAFTVTYTPVTPACSHAQERYVDMYECAAPGPLRKPVKNKGVLYIDKETVRQNDPFSSCLLKLSAICQYVTRRGGQGNWLFNFFSAFWGSGNSDWRVVGAMTIDPTSSTKRLSLEHAVRSHQMACFPNARNTVKCTAANLQRSLDHQSLQFDFVSIVQSSCTMMMIEVAATGDLSVPLVKNFVMHQDMTIETDDDIYRPSPDMDADGLLAMARSVKNPDIFMALSHILTAGPLDEVVLPIVVQHPPLTSDPYGPQYNVVAFNKLVGAVPSAPVFGLRYTPSAVPDVRGGNVPPNLLKVLEQYSSRLSPAVRSAMTLTIAAASVYRQWKDLEILYLPWDEIAAWWKENQDDTSLVNICNITRGLCSGQTYTSERLTKIFRYDDSRCFKNCLRRMASHRTPCEECAPKIASQLYCFVRGRLPRSSSYMMAAAMGHSMLKPLYRSAVHRYRKPPRDYVKVAVSYIFESLANNMILTASKRQWVIHMMEGLNMWIRTEFEVIATPNGVPYAIPEVPISSDEGSYRAYAEDVILGWSGLHPELDEYIQGLSQNQWDYMVSVIQYLILDGFVYIEGPLSLMLQRRYDPITLPAEFDIPMDVPVWNDMAMVDNVGPAENAPAADTQAVQDELAATCVRFYYAGCDATAFALYEGHLTMQSPEVVNVIGAGIVDQNTVVSQGDLAMFLQAMQMAQGAAMGGGNHIPDVL